MSWPPDRTIDELARELEDAVRELIIAAPACTPAQVGTARRGALALALRWAHDAMAEGVALACAIERCLELMLLGELDLGVGLPPLAMAAASAGQGRSAVVAARYEVETLLPVPGRAASRSHAGPDVSVRALLRGRASAQPATASAADPLAEVSAGWADAPLALVAAARQRLRQ